MVLHLSDIIRTAEHDNKDVEKLVPKMAMKMQGYGQQRWKELRRDMKAHFKYPKGLSHRGGC